MEYFLTISVVLNGTLKHMEIESLDVSDLISVTYEYNHIPNFLPCKMQKDQRWKKMGCTITLTSKV